MITFNQIKEKINKSRETIDIGFGVPFNHFETLKRIYHYKNSKHLKGEIDPITKKRKPFPNISRFRARIVAKMIDFDVKDIRVITNKVFDLFSQLKAYILERKIKDWAKRNGFGFLMNDVIKSVVDCGSCVVFYLKGEKPQVVDLKSLFFDVSVDRIRKSDFIIWEKKFSKIEILEKKNVWENVDKLLSSDKDEFTIYYYFGKFLEDDNVVNKLIIISEPEKKEKDGVILFEEKIDYYPFYDFHINKISGRWLGVGVYEELFDPQIRILTISGLKARALELASKQVFQTQDKTAYKNLVTDVETGDVIIGSFTQIPFENRSLVQFNDEQSFWDLLSDRLTFTYDVIRGEALPATTPATNATIQSQMASSSFDQMRESLAFQFVEFLLDIVLKDIKSELGREFVLRFISSFDELQMFDQIISSLYAEKIKNEFLRETGFIPENLDEIKSEIMLQLKLGGLARSVKIPSGFFSDISDVDIIIDTETRNLPLEANNLNTILQIISQNPSILDIPLTRTMLMSYAEKVGLSPVDISGFLETKKVINTQNYEEVKNNERPETSVPQPVSK